MSKDGWISVHRQIQDCWIWQGDTFSRGQAWIDLLLFANHRDTKIMFNGNLIDIEIGSFITSISKLANRWKWSRHKVSDFLNVLENDKMIEQIRDSRKTLINIVNYSAFQSAEARQGHKKDIPRTSQGHHKDTDNNDNNDNNDVINLRSTFSDTQKVVDAWNNLGLAKLTKISDGTNRYKLLKARIRDYGLEEVLRAIDNVNNSQFLRTSTFFCFDWMIKPNNFPKVLEGNYNDKQPAKQEKVIDNDYKDEFGLDFDEFFKMQEMQRNGQSC